MQAAVVVAAFNLVCNVHASGDDVLPAASERVITYRVDPMLGRWCEGSCPAALPIAAMPASEIVLVHVRPDGHRPGSAIRIAYLTGDYRETNFSLGEDQERLDIVGRCERAPFSGFPPESLRFATPLRVEVPSSID